MFLLLFGRDSSLPLRNYSKVEFKTRKEIKWFGELLKDHQKIKPLRAAFIFWWK